jgi:hypothetical protein
MKCKQKRNIYSNWKKTPEMEKQKRFVVVEVQLKPLD